jgi:hypothetical protein
VTPSTTKSISSPAALPFRHRHLDSSLTVAPTVAAVTVALAAGLIMSLIE